jgi:hypothetical protein
MLLPGDDSELDIEWPQGDPAALMWWLEEGGAQRLGRNTNKWLGVIFYASSMIRNTPDAAERRAYRDVALAAIEMGQRTGGLSEDMRVEKVIYARMSYIRASEEGPEWRRGEMGRVAETFLDWVPMDIETARSKSEIWMEQPLDVVKSLRRIKTLLKLMQPGVAYLTGDLRQTLNEWLSLAPLLP